MVVSVAGMAMRLEVVERSSEVRLPPYFFNNNDNSGGSQYSTGDSVTVNKF